MFSFVDGVFKVQAALLRGTMYTLESSVDKAMADFERVVSTGDEPALSKVLKNFNVLWLP